MNVHEDRPSRWWSFEQIGLRAYDFITKHEILLRPQSRILWGADVRVFYADIAAIRDMPAGSSVLDVPCGGGVAFRGLSADAPIRFVAADASEFMLRRARAEAARRKLEGIEFVQADVEKMPFDDAEFDLCVTYHGLHCFPDPQVAIAEMVRVLRPGGELRGTVLVTGGSRISKASIAFFKRRNQFGMVGSADDIERWLKHSGLYEVQLHLRGAYLHFSGRRPAAEK